MKDPTIRHSHTSLQKDWKSFCGLACLIFGTLWLSCIPLSAKAEGTKELTSSGGYRPSTMYQSTGQYFGISYKTIIKVYAKAGETIYTGSSANGLGSGSIRLTAPNGTVYTSTGISNEGVIQDRSQELAGPAPNSGGYTPFSRLVGATQAGVWTVDFISPDPSSIFNGAPQLTAEFAWSRTNDQFNNVPTLLAWDVTVRNAGGTEQKGRSYTNSFAYTMGNYDPVTLSSIFYVLTKDGYQYAVDTNALGPFASIFFSNNRGWKTGVTPTYKSSASLPGNVQDPLDPDTANDITNKLFFNRPANDLPSSSTSASGAEWLLVPPVIPTASSLAYTPSGASGGTFTFSANVAGSYEIWMDVNNNGSYNDPVDRIIQGLNTAGNNSVIWNGRNGLGVAVSNPVNFPVRVATRSGEVHFPMIDAESSLSGIKITRLNGMLAPDSYIYWDDTSINKSGFTSTKSITGTLSSPGGAHSWGPGGATGYGDAVGIDTWAFGRGDWKFFGVAISGRVFEDINYGGGLGRDASTASLSLRQNVRVELYDGSGNFKAFTTTDGAGHYEFHSSTIPGGLTAGNYTVRVANSTVTSSRSSSTISLLPVQTYRVDASTGTAISDLDRVGGEVPEKIDASANTTNKTLSALTTLITTAQSIAPVKMGIAHVPDINFGYNFDTIVNTNNTGQGSLRQFIINSNNLSNIGLAQVGQIAGLETSIFMIPNGTATPGLRAGLTNQLTSGVGVINLTTAYPNITDTSGLGTGFIGTTQPVGGSGIRVQIDGANLPLSGNGAGTGLCATARIVVDTIAITKINGNNTATSTYCNSGAGIHLAQGADDSIIKNALISENQSSGIETASVSSLAASVRKSGQILNNTISNNGSIAVPEADGISLNGTLGFTINKNIISGSTGYGIDLGPVGSGMTNDNHVISSNTISGNGTATGSQEIAGIGVRQGSNNRIFQNTIFNNIGDGVMVRSNGAIASLNNQISQNSIYDNGELGIDLGNATTNNGDGVTANEGTVLNSLTNKGIDYPIITSSTLTGTTLNVKGFVGSIPAGSNTFANVILEFFIADNSPANQNGEVILGDGKSKPHGEGRTYIGTCYADSEGLFGTVANPCTFTNVDALGLTDPKNITATATDTSEGFGNTSEFSPPVANNPNVLLVKRITRLNNSTTSSGDDLSIYKDENTNPYDDNDITIPPPGNPPTAYPDTKNWPVDSNNIPILLGGTKGGNTKPGDEIEYTIYFLSDGEQLAKSVLVCDKIPDNQTFVPNTYNNIAPLPGGNNLAAAPNGLSGQDRGISVLQNGTNFSYTNVGADDTAEFYPPGSTLPPACNGAAPQAQDNGTIVVNLGDVENATAPGTPTGAYGFIRFRVKVN